MRSLFTTFNLAMFFQLVPSIGINLSKNSLTYFITSCPLLGSYLSLPPSSDSIILVPYKLSYKLTHLAFAAFNAYLAFIIGTTNCGPAI